MSMVKQPVAIKATIPRAILWISVEFKHTISRYFLHYLGDTKSSKNIFEILNPHDLVFIYLLQAYI